MLLEKFQAAPSVFLPYFLGFLASVGFDTVMETNTKFYTTTLATMVEGLGIYF
jgi:hypothetical protein